MKKIRLDCLVVEKGFAESREKAKRLILSGSVVLKTDALTKPGIMVSIDLDITLKERDKYVSRGGLKIEGFFKDNPFSVKGFKCLDIGASTGGFTDFLLQNGAEEMVCVDVGYGVLHLKLRQHKQVKLFEKVNARALSKALVGNDFDLIVIDVSFISLTLIFPAAISLLKKGGLLLCLVKPQFEAGRKFVGKGGVVRSIEIQKKCVDKIIDFGKESSLSFKKYKECVLKGPKGNQEYFCLFEKNI